MADLAYSVAAVSPNPLQIRVHCDARNMYIMRYVITTRRRGGGGGS